ncbi:ABC-F family ATP-binding cassette domain-containing protein [Sphingomonas sp. HITSZ_GF]|uniref:ABC-F family ATP-binding cassette domain-containing protein n=1 Tax=Sphingomonas sp. HITSZ_GF TaxID=3037247 RepID=UPI00240D58C5|nr:ABC-F family ATP-binding cassette domain-containing protein [Sphingomonas sp. HITSZ_GF]MDG2533950.1 ABC-F family ATP-binding cassette domain-containing protein [Sphingomonas sp. HITSZ_GF]
MLSFRDITIRLGGRAIIEGASAAIPPRARVGFIGRNGAGKSTLMKAIAGMIETDTGSVDIPRNARFGYLRQDAPGGQTSAFDTVLEADVERAALLLEAETQDDPDRLGHIYERLDQIDAYEAPARAGRILKGLGFDEAMQARPMDSFSGGWRMRVALASLLFLNPDILLLDEPSNHLDLEAVMWLEGFLRAYRGTILLISHERDLLNNVADHILHLDRGQTTLYPGGYDAFERQRAERLAQQAAAREKQVAEREKLQAFVDRWRAKASKAKQAQSRVKALERMQPIAAVAEDPSLTFQFPNPQGLRPPLLTLDHASVGYEEGKPILSRLGLRLDPDDRIAFLGRNGNGKTTLARMIAGELPVMDGEMTTATKLTVGYFTQYQVEELDPDATPVETMGRVMKGATPVQVRSQLGRFGFSGDKALTKVGKLSGGERARLALALVTHNAPHLLILDEPTNHLDVDTREALVQALAEFKGAVVLVSHDRHMLELVADRLFLVDGGTAREYDGTIEDYAAFIVSGKPAPGTAGAPADKKGDRRAGAEARQATTGLRKAVSDAETELTKAQKALAEVDAALAGNPPKWLKSLSMGDLMKRRGEIEAQRETAEAAWLEASEALEAAN